MKRRDQSAFLAKLWALEDALVAEGFPAMPEWWRKTITRFYLSGKRRLVVRKGRRVFASTCVAPRLAVAEMLFGEHAHLRGTPPNAFVFLSVKRDEAAKRLRGIHAILDALGETYTARGDTIELIERPAVFAVMTANFRTSVGDTVAFAWCDEVARWMDDALAANPAEHVIGSLAPALATLPDAPLFLVSSPWTVGDYHAKAFEQGETAGQAIAFGETWVINPTLTEQATHELEPDERTWRREYAAIPSPTAAEPFFPEDAILRCVDKGRLDASPRVDGRRYVIALDQAFLRDRFGLAVVSSEVVDPDDYGHRDGRITTVHVCESWAPTGDVLASLRRVASACHLFDQRRVYIDQHGGAPMRELLRRLRVYAEIVNWTGGDGEDSKLARYRAVRDAMIVGRLRLPDSPELLAELRAVQSELMSTGNERIVIRRTAGGHGDAATALVLAVSQALKGPAWLPRSRMTQWERDERYLLRKRASEMIGAPIMFHDELLEYLR